MFSAVLEYDRTFRQLIAADPSVQWNRRDDDLYAKAFTGQGLAEELASHPDQSFVQALLSSLRDRADIGFRGPRRNVLSPNLPSAC